MQQLEEVPQTYEDAVRTLVRWHAEDGPADLRVFSFPDPANEIVRLIEVSEDFLDTGTVIYPLTLRAFPEFPFQSTAALASPRQWQAAEAGEIPLPAGFDIATKEQVWP